MATKTYPKLDRITVMKDPRFTKLVSDIQRVWNEIGYDCMSCSEEMGETCSQADKLEACLDADRMTTIARSPESDKFVAELCKKYGYPQVVRFLGTQVSL